LRTWVIPLENATASDIADRIKELYKSAMATSSAGPQFVLPFGPQPQQSQQAAKPPALAVTTDDRSNSLILQASEGMYKDIRYLVETLDTATVNNPEVVKVVSLKGLDPALVQQAVSAIQGINPLQQQRGGFGGGGFGGGGPGGGFGGFGGGGPGGGG